MPAGAAVALDAAVTKWQTDSAALISRLLDDSAGLRAAPRRMSPVMRRVRPPSRRWPITIRPEDMGLALRLPQWLFPSADIDWVDSGDIREVFNAAAQSRRGSCSKPSGNGIAVNFLHSGRGGQASEAAKESIGRGLSGKRPRRPRQPRSARECAGTVKLPMTWTRSRKAGRPRASRPRSLGMIVDAATNTIELVRDRRGADPDGDHAQARWQLQPQLDAILAEAATVDMELAMTINMATGAAPIPEI